MKFIKGALYTRNGRGCVLMGKERDSKNQLIVIVKFVGTSYLVRMLSNEFNGRFRLVKGAGKHIKVKGWKRR